MAKKRRKTKRDQPVFEPVPRTRVELKIKARNDTQKDYIRAIRSHDISFGMGAAGTGKSYISSLLAMQALINEEVDKIVICRPAVTAGGEDLGFLPGDVAAKMDPYLQPIFDAFKTYWNPNTIKQHLAEGKIEIVPLAYMRGRSFNNSFIISDEMQNASKDNLLMLLTRLGYGSKMVITGDPIQSDVGNKSCFHVAESILGEIDEIAFTHFTNADVVRHPTVAKILNHWPDNGMVV